MIKKGKSERLLPVSARNMRLAFFRVLGAVPTSEDQLQDSVTAWLGSIDKSRLQNKSSDSYRGMGQLKPIIKFCILHNILGFEETKPSWENPSSLHQGNKVETGETIGTLLQPLYLIPYNCTREQMQSQGISIFSGCYCLQWLAT